MQKNCNAPWREENQCTLGLSFASTPRYRKWRILISLIPAKKTGQEFYLSLRKACIVCKFCYKVQQNLGYPNHRGDRNRLDSGGILSNKGMFN